MMVFANVTEYLYVCQRLRFRFRFRKNVANSGQMGDYVTVEGAGQ